MFQMNDCQHQIYACDEKKPKNKNKNWRLVRAESFQCGSVKMFPLIYNERSKHIAVVLDFRYEQSN